MSNVIGIMIAAILILSGGVLMATWWPLFIKALMAMVPLLLILTGVGLLAYFISEIKSKSDMREQKSPAAEEKKPRGRPSDSPD